MIPVSSRNDLELLDAILRMPDRNFTEYDRKAQFRGMMHALTNGTIRKLPSRQRAHAEEVYTTNGLDKIPLPPPAKKKTKDSPPLKVPALPGFAFELLPRPLKPPGKR